MERPIEIGDLFYNDQDEEIKVTDNGSMIEYTINECEGEGSCRADEFIKIMKRKA